jgi:glutaminase
MADVMPYIGEPEALDDLPALLDRVLERTAPMVGLGRVADYIPALACIDPSRFGIAVATVDGRVHGAGDWCERFSLQSVSKVFTLALAMRHEEERIWTRVGREPSGNPFNSLVQLEYEQGIPRNPFINAGSLVITDHLLSATGDSTGALLDLLRAELDDPGVEVDAVVAESEAAHGELNAALAHFMASYGNIENPVETVLDQYVRQCAVRLSCGELARAGLFLARHGRRRDGGRLLTEIQAKRINAIMLTCGAYDAAGEFAYRVGLPGKSGVGGGVLAVVPRVCAIGVWGPGLDAQGNSISGVAALEHFTDLTGLSIF